MDLSEEQLEALAKIAMRSTWMKHGTHAQAKIGVKSLIDELDDQRESGHDISTAAILLLGLFEEAPKPRTRTLFAVQDAAYPHESGTKLLFAESETEAKNLGAAYFDVADGRSMIRIACKREIEEARIYIDNLGIADWDEKKERAVIGLLEVFMEDL